MQVPEVRAMSWLAGCGFDLDLDHGFQRLTQGSCVGLPYVS